MAFAGQLFAQLQNALYRQLGRFIVQLLHRVEVIFHLIGNKDAQQAEHTPGKGLVMGEQ